MMAKQTPYTGPPPPNLPSIDDSALATYLTNFALWAKNGLANKLDTQTAAPGILLQAYDAAPGTIPAVYMLRVNTAGEISLTPVALGSGVLGTPVTIVAGSVHNVRVTTVSSTLNNAVAAGGILRFDTIDYDTDAFAPVTSPFNHLTIPTGLGGTYIINGWSSGSGTQATTLGMGLLLNGTTSYSTTNQTITGPASVNYTLDNAAVVILHLAAGDTLQLVNNSSAGPSVFTSTTFALTRIESGLVFA